MSAPDATFCCRCGRFRFFLLKLRLDPDDGRYVCYGCTERPENITDESAELLMARGEIKDVY